MQLWSESTRYFSTIQWIRISDSWIRTVIRIVTEFNPRDPWAMPYPSKKFHQNLFTTFSVIRQTDRQTDKQTKVKTRPPCSEEVTRVCNISKLHVGIFCSKPVTITNYFYHQLQWMCPAIDLNWLGRNLLNVDFLIL